MAKGQLRSGREPKKPKSSKKKPHEQATYMGTTAQTVTKIVPEAPPKHGPAH